MSGRLTLVCCELVDSFHTWEITQDEDWADALHEVLQGWLSSQ